MAGTSSSLVVKISADLNDFLSSLDKMTKGVDKAAERVAAFGEKLTIGVTLPLVAAATAMAKFAADSEDTSARFQRTFGSAADSVKESIESMKKVVPETTDELEKLATQTDIMLQGMEVAPATAAQMSSSMLKLAADMAAVAHVPIGTALEALDKGLAGRSRGLIEYGLGFSKLELQQEAYRQNLLHTGSTLTEAGTAQASFNLIMQKAGLIQGEAARTAGESSKSWQFLSRDLKELGVSIGEIVLPAFVKIVDAAKDAVNWINNLSDGTKHFLVDLAALIGIVGPVVFAVGKLTKVFFDVSSAFKLLSSGGGIAGIFTAASNPIGQFILAVTALAAIVWGLSAAWDAASSSLTDFLGKRGLLPSTPTGFVGVLPGTSSFGLTSQGAYNQSRDQGVLGNDPILAAFVAKNFSTPLSTKGGPSDARLGTPFQQLEKDAALAQTAFARAADYGTSIAPVLAKINQYHAEAVGFIKSGADAFSEESVKAQALADKLQVIRDAAAVYNAPTTAAAQGVLNQIGQRPVDAGFLGSQSAAVAYNAYYKDLATRSGASQFKTPFEADTEATIASRKLAGYDGKPGSVANDLALREALLKLPDGFDAARLASVEYAESQRSATESMALEYEKLKLNLGQFGIHLGDLSPVMQQVTLSIANAAIQFAQTLAGNAGGGGKGAGLGRSLGGLAGGLLGTIFGPAGTVVGSLTGAALGSAVGTVAGSIAGGFLGGAFDHAKTSVDNAASSIDNMTKAVTAVTQSLTNVPQFFNQALYRYLAGPPLPPPAPSPPSYVGPLPPSGSPGSPGSPQAPSGGGPIPGAPSGTIVVNGNLVFPNVTGNGQNLTQELLKQGLRLASTGASARFAFASGGVLR